MSDERWHGTAGGYNNHRCRCDRCTAAWREYCRTGGYMAKYREKLTAAGLSRNGSFRTQIPLKRAK